MTLRPCMIMLGEPENDDNCFSNLDDPNFLKRLREIDIENLNMNTHKRLEHTCNSNLKFNATKLKKTNMFCSLICEWVHKVVKYQRRKSQTFMKHQSPKRNGSPKRYGSPVRINQSVNMTANQNVTMNTRNRTIQAYKKEAVNANVNTIKLDLTPEKKIPEDLDQLPFYLRESI